MEEQSVREIIKATHWPRTMATAALGVLALFLLIATLSELKSYRYIGSGVTATNTISVSGEGFVFAVPDIATFSVTVTESAKDVTTAQTSATKKSNDIVAYLKNQAIEDKDVQTTDYSINPQYDYTNGACEPGVYCRPGTPVLRGYEVSQTLTVKVRDTKKAGDILSGVGKLGASSVSGLNFTVADEDSVVAQARDKAIQNAKAKAETLAGSLGVTIVRVVGFNEGGGGPVYYAKSALSMDAAGSTAPSPEIPVGQNKITSNVTITYEIR
ncbi:SIMPL domain-containing protein [Candidatus Kaiserbacteria bacterium]|nr:SIMPL domain-containing protein [Candidatus Kaiserbacteria bacterium]